MAENKKKKNGFYKGVERFAVLTRDFGMPIIAFAAGIYTIIMVIHNFDLLPIYKVGIGLILVIAGLLSQMYIFNRENPRIRSINKSDQQAFQKISQTQTNNADKNIPPLIILEVLSTNKEQWINQFNCVDIKLGKKKSNNVQFELNCLLFLVNSKNPLKIINKVIPVRIAYVSKGITYQIPTDVVEVTKISTHKNHYEELTEEEQYELVDGYIDQNVDELLETYTSITGVYAGKKKIGGHEIPLVSLILQVEKKRNHSTKPLPTFVEHNNYKIPTDIKEAGKTQLNFSLNPLKEGISRENETESGSIGFPLYYNNKLHMVSCYHVLFPEELNSGSLITNSPLNDTAVVHPPHKFGNSSPVGEVIEGQVSKHLDLALLKPNQKLLDILEQEGYSKEWTTLSRKLENKSYLKFYGSKSKETKVAKLLKIATVQPIDYGVNGIINLRGLIQMEKKSLPGDSGAAVYNSFGEIVGIILGSDTHSTYAISAYNIFDKTDYYL